ncbi:acetolactate synthase catalytic subunit [Sphingopyxis lindanitolerans]|uniref:Acetolactate synthase catalytic subunit n=1 Tax=Sphingopyxis lindanitolerans TaxID=2054227 RepID=A0A2S8B9R8_9SPHN|nr:acetolactate synthase catalytic subunit [Sphingopyxis lindanitolerans]PQM29108.1 acetolactate synthase catalytic subunit [Sphingopyxis lindanitolerans]
MTKSVSDVIAAALVRHGVDFIFGQSNPTALMLAAEEAGIRQLLYRTENAAGAMADAYSRVSGRIGVVAAQNGPAATLMVAPMAEALTASIPMLVLVQEVPAAQRDRNAFQEFDHFALFAGVSKWTRRLDDPNRAAEYIDLAMIAANSGRPGPVVLLLAKDMLMQPCTPSPFVRTRNLGGFPLDRPRPEAAAVEMAAQLLAEAKAPVVIVGGGVHGSGATDEVARLVDVGQLPVATTFMGKGAIDETAPLSLGVAANITGENGPAAAHRAMFEKADVVLLIGTRTNENGTDAWTLTAPGATYIHIDIAGEEVGRTYEAVRLVGDARSAVSDLADALARCDLTLRRSQAPALRGAILSARAARLEAIRAECESSSRPILPQRMMAELDRLISPDDIVVADASYSSVWVTGYLTARRAGQRVITPRGLAGLGWGLPYAIGAKLARPEARVVALVGDGGFAHVWAELEMAVREDIPLTLIVLNNSQLAMQRHGENLGFGRSTTGIEFIAVDHAAVARSVGAVGVRIDDPDDFGPALAAAMASGQVTLLDVISSADASGPLRIFDGQVERLATPPTTNPARELQSV